MAQGPLDRYRALLKSGRLKPDPEQARVAAALDGLSHALKHYRPVSGNGGLVSRLLLRRPPEPPLGLYVHGAVGRGKSLLMDLFFAAAPVEKKRRVHFNSFMMDAHQRIHEWRNLSDDERAARPEFVREAGDDPIAPVAKHIFGQGWLLCFDEFQVTDVADAMILGRLFEKLFALGAVIVATSNTPPDRLYEGGLNRQLFLPFIAMIKEKLAVLELGGGQDYRADRMAGLHLYNTPLGREADAAMDRAWKDLTNGAPAREMSLEVYGRPFVVPRAARGVARFSFDALCGEARSAADYIVLARNFHTLLLDHIPILAEHNANEARRLTLLIDTLYDERAKLVVSAAAPPQQLFPGAGENGWFERTASRLLEMQSADYLVLAPGAQAPVGTEQRAAG
jgi:cell division protein ZapE